jgi:hypothetical protein
MNRLKTLALAAGRVCGLAAFALGIGLISDPAWALNGKLVLHDCTDDQAAQLHRAFAYVKTDFLTNPGPMLEVLKGYHSQGQIEAANDIQFASAFGATISGYPEYVMSRMAEDVPTEITCNLPTNSAGFQDGVEKIGLTTLSDNDLTLAGVIEHEIAHNKGFSHLNPSPDNVYSAPRIFQSAAGVGTSLGKFDLRANLNPETMLAPVGLDFRAFNPGDAYLDVQCFDLKYAAGLLIGSSPSMSSLWLICKAKSDDAHDTDTWQIPFPNTSSSLARSRCANGQVLVDAWGYADTKLQSIGPICAPEAAVLARSSSTTRGSTIGLDTGLPWTRQCPSGMAVKSFKAQASDTVHVIELNCQEYQSPEDLVFWNLPAQGLGNGDTDVLLERAIGRSALTGRHVALSSGSEKIARLGATFDQLNGTGANTCRYGYTLYLPSHGLWTDGTSSFTGTVTAQESRCSSNAALVGLYALWDGPIKGLGGVCADVAQWNQDDGSPALIYIRSLGFDTALYGSTEMCPRRAFVVGWFFQASDGIDYLSTLCRQF